PAVRRRRRSFEGVERPSSRGDPRGDYQLGDDNPRARAFARHAVELELIVCAVDDAQAFVDVAQADSAGIDSIGVIRRNADAVVDDVDDGVAVVPRASD